MYGLRDISRLAGRERRQLAAARSGTDKHNNREINSACAALDALDAPDALEMVKAADKARMAMQHAQQAVRLKRWLNFYRHANSVVPLSETPALTADAEITRSSESVPYCLVLGGVTNVKVPKPVLNEIKRGGYLDGGVQGAC